ncbi:hypothetical protein J4466_01070 [Candidatus Pacearchaeota archaeon]|nr:hypothetical protein [Candidatus Pacearchaeota archaeon]
MQKTQHDGDCTIYSVLANHLPRDGICICGYGLELLREKVDVSELYSKELQSKLFLNKEIR